MQQHPFRIVVIGGGVIGLSVAWRLARASHAVTLLDARLDGAASRVSAGMVGPVSEYGFDHDDFYAFGMRSYRRYPAFLDELAVDSGVHVPLSHHGALMVALDHDDMEAIRRVYDFRKRRALPVEWLTGKEARAREPLLSPRVCGAMWTADEREVDNRAMLDALTGAAGARGVDTQQATATRIETARDHTILVHTTDGLMHADRVVTCAGAFAARIEGVGGRLPVRPVKGQAVRLVRTSACPLALTIRTPDVYLVPKADGTIVVGATEEEMGFDTASTAGAVLKLLERAWEAVPGIYELPVKSMDAGLRPGTRDHLPLIGPVEAGVIAAAGHYRHGILLAPATADAVVHGISTGRWEDVAAFAPGRFADAVPAVARDAMQGERDGTQG